jgi:hypothetical protein
MKNPTPPRDLASLIASARQLVAASLTFHAETGMLTTAADALTEPEARAAVSALESAGIRHATVAKDVDGRWGVVIPTDQSAQLPTFERAIELLAQGHLDARRFVAALFERTEGEVHSAMREAGVRRS